MMSEDSGEDERQVLQDTFFGEEETFIADKQDKLLYCFGVVKDYMANNGFPVLDRCSFPQFCQFVFRLHERIAADGKKLHPSFDPIPWGLLEDEEEADGRFIKRILGLEQWIYVNRQGILYTHDALISTLFPDCLQCEGYMREVATFCFERSSMTKKRQRAMTM